MRACASSAATSPWSASTAGDAARQVSELLERIGRSRLEIRRHRLGLLDVAIHQLAEQSQLDRERDDLLLRAVVQVALELLGAFVLRGHQALARRPEEIVDVRLELGGEASVPQDQAGLRCGEVLQELVLGGRDPTRPAAS